MLVMVVMMMMMMMKKKDDNCDFTLNENLCELEHARNHATQLIQFFETQKTTKLLTNIRQEEIDSTVSLLKKFRVSNLIIHEKKQ